MIDDLQQLVFDVNEYERPGDQWVCGRACEGTPCARGPSARGQCGAICQPRKVGDHYFCENASLIGGKCDEGPHADGSCCHWPPRCAPLKKGIRFVCGLGVCSEGPRPDGSCCQPIAPCRPVRRALGKRKIVTLCVFALSLGIGLLMVGGPWRQQASTPGDLSSHHSGLANQCSACHRAADGTLDELLHAALVGDDTYDDAASLDQKCLACHRDLQPAADHPHTADSALLDALTEKAQRQHAGGGPLMSRLAKIAFPHDGSISCARCHREHQGVDHSLAALSDAQCQTCHVSTIESFSRGHSEFANYPYMRRSRIYFDHVSHYGVHFRDAGRLPAAAAATAFLVKDKTSEETCAKCHVSDRAGRKMLVRAFDHTCGACHAEQITDDLSPGMIVLRFPVFDRKRLGKEANEVWPIERAKHAEARGSLSPILRLLLAGNADFAALDSHLAALDLSNLEGAGEDQLAAAKKLPAVLKQQLDELATGGSSGIEQRLSRYFGQAASADQIALMAKLIPVAHLELARDRWFKETDVVETNLKAANDGARGAYLRDRDLSLRYRADRHADPVLRAWIDAAVRVGSDADVASGVHQLYRTLSHIASTGRCLKCHTIERSQDGTAFVNWNPYQGGSLGSFTTFSHRPHVVMLRDKNCQQCHVLSTRGALQTAALLYRSEYFAAEGDARVGFGEFHPNFEHIGKSACASCHRRGRVSQNCTTCHRYHVRRPESLGPSR